MGFLRQPILQVSIVPLYKEGFSSLGYIAEEMGVLKQDLTQELLLRHIEPEFSESTLKEELE